MQQSMLDPWGKHRAPRSISLPINNRPTSREVVHDRLMLSWVLFSTLRLVTVSKKPQQMASEYSVRRDCRTGVMRDIVRLPGRGGSVPGVLGT